MGNFSDILADILDPFLTVDKRLENKLFRCLGVEMSGSKELRQMCAWYV